MEETGYILKLSFGKYYVGKTTNIFKRIEEHKNGGCEWTLRFLPILEFETFSIQNKYSETNQTLVLMEKYGIDNVRGGIYISIDLDEQMKRNFEYRKKLNLCLRCGRQHPTLNCYAETDYNKQFIPNDDTCFRCYNDNHYASDCYATWDVFGNKL